MEVVIGIMECVYVNNRGGCCYPEVLLQNGEWFAYWAICKRGLAKERVIVSFLLWCLDFVYEVWDCWRCSSSDLGVEVPLWSTLVRYCSFRSLALLL